MKNFRKHILVYEMKDSYEYVSETYLNWRNLGIILYLWALMAVVIMKGIRRIKWASEIIIFDFNYSVKEYFTAFLNGFSYSLHSFIDNINCYASIRRSNGWFRIDVRNKTRRLFLF